MRSKPLFLSLLFLVALVPASGTAASTNSPEPGDWWRVQYTDLVGGATNEFTYVVSERTADTAVIGIAASDVGAIPFVMPLMPVGTVRLPELTFVAAGSEFQPTLANPIEGASWQTEWAGIPIQGTITDTSDSRVHVSFRHVEGGDHHGSLIIERGWIVEHIVDDFAAARVVQHGYDADCHLYLPTVTKSLGLMPLTPFTTDNARIYHLETEEAFDHLALLLIAHAPNPGDAASVVVSSSEQKVAEASADGTSGTTYALKPYWIEAPRGIWHSHEASSGNGHVSFWAIGLNHMMGGPATHSDCAGVVGDRSGPVSFAGASSAPIASSPEFRLLTASLAALGLLLVYAARRGFFFALFVKLSPDQVEQQRVRALLLELIRNRPGLTTQELRNEASIAWGAAVYHLSVLERGGNVVATNWGRHRHWFDPRRHPKAQRALLAALQHAPARKIIETIQERPGIRQKEMAEAVLLHRATVRFHTTKLEALGLLEKRVESGEQRYFLRV